MTHCKVQRRPRFGCSYFHHFIIIRIDQRKMTVAHYTDTFPVFAGIAESVGEFVVDTFTLEKDRPDEPCDLLDFSKGVYIVTPLAERRNYNDLISRLLQRMNESKYNVTTNNCEHVVNDILYDTTLENQSDSKCCKSNIVGGMINNVKNMGMKIVLLIPFLGALLGSLGRRSHVKILASAFYFSLAYEDNDTCALSNIGQNAIDSIQQEILGLTDILEDVLKKHNYTFDENVQSNVSEMLTNPLVCEAANSISENDISDILFWAIAIPLLIELYLSENVLQYYMETLLGKILNKQIIREYAVQFFALILANSTVGVFGYIVLSYSSKPLIWLFVSYIMLGAVSRVGFTMVFGCIVDKILAKIRNIMSVKKRSKKGVKFWGVIFPIFCLSMAIKVAIILTEGVL